MSKIKIRGANIYYEEHGQGTETVLLIHGLFMNCRMYDQQVAALKDRYRVVVYDLRGQGESEVTAGGYGIYEQVEDVAKLIEQLECAPCHVAGISMGGYIAMRLAKRYPQLVRSLILLSTSAAEEARADAAKVKFLAFVHHRISQPFAVSQVEPMLFGEKYLNDPAYAQTQTYWHQQFLSNNKLGIARTINSILSRDNMLGELADMDVPTLIISGEADMASDPAQSERMHAELPNSQLVKIPEIGHTPPLEASETVNSAVLDFLGLIAISSRRNFGAGLIMAQLVQEPDYKAYILRVWKESKQWRFSIEPIGSGRRQGFSHLEQLVAFLEEVAPAVDREDPVAL